MIKIENKKEKKQRIATKYRNILSQGKSTINQEKI
jgi:hypothetical protein